MAIIKYSEMTDGWSRSKYASYEQYFNTQWRRLEKTNNLRNALSEKKAKSFVTTVNGIDLTLKEEDIAKWSTAKLNDNNLKVESKVASLYTEVEKSCDQVGAGFNEAFSEKASALLAIQQGLVPDGTNFTVNSKEVLNLEQAAIGAAQKKYNSISNLLGYVGEGVSSMAGAAITNVVIEQLQKQLGGTAKVTAEAIYENTGANFTKTYRSQTDNRLTLAVKITPNDGGNVATFNLTYNISDKATKRLGKLSKQTKTTGKLKIRNSRVSVFLNALRKDAVYNTISYHKDKHGNKYTAMPGESVALALRRYMGYKMLIDTFIESKAHNDEISFTVYGNKIIHESSVLEKLLSSNKNGKERYLAEIRYYQLKDRKIRGVNHAESIINTMPVEMSGSFDFPRS